MSRCSLIVASVCFTAALMYPVWQFGVPAFKVGSGECNNYPLMELIAKEGKPVCSEHYHGMVCGRL